MPELLEALQDRDCLTVLLYVQLLAQPYSNSSKKNSKEGHRGQNLDPRPCVFHEAFNEEDGTRSEPRHACIQVDTQGAIGNA